MTSIVEGMAAAAALTAEYPVAVPRSPPTRRRLRPERSLPQKPLPAGPRAEHPLADRATGRSS
jgi:hypothetical protein